jgi:hypothetical protein
LSFHSFDFCCFRFLISRIFLSNSGFGTFYQTIGWGLELLERRFPRGCFMIHADRGSPINCEQVNRFPITEEDEPNLRAD